MKRNSSWKKVFAVIWAAILLPFSGPNALGLGNDSAPKGRAISPVAHATQALSLPILPRAWPRRVFDAFLRLTGRSKGGQDVGEATPDPKQGYPAGTLVSRYVLERRVDREGPCEVYSGYHPRDPDRKLEIKLSDPARGRAGRDAIRRETDLLRPHRFKALWGTLRKAGAPTGLPVVLDAGDRNGIPFLVREPLEGFVRLDRLYSQVKAGNRDDVEALASVTVATTRTLAMLNSMGIVHNHLSAETIKVRVSDKGMQAVFVDYSHATSSRYWSRWHIPLGERSTPWPAPELTPDQIPSSKSDQYALGQTLLDLFNPLFPARRSTLKAGGAMAAERSDQGAPFSLQPISGVALDNLKKRLIKLTLNDPRDRYVNAETAHRMISNSANALRSPFRLGEPTQKPQVPLVPRSPRRAGLIEYLSRPDSLRISRYAVVGLSGISDFYFYAAAHDRRRNDASVTLVFVRDDIPPAKQEEARQRWQREERIRQQLAGSKTVNQIVRVESDQPKNSAYGPFVVLEPLELVTLDPQNDLDKTLLLFRKMLAAVEALEAAGYAHGHLTLADFAWAQADRKTLVLTSLGEAWDLHTLDNRRVDVQALGRIFQRMLHGGENIDPGAGDPTDDAWIPDSWRGFTKAARYRWGRYESVKDMAAAFDRRYSSEYFAQRRRAARLLHLGQLIGINLMLWGIGVPGEAIATGDLALVAAAFLSGPVQQSWLQATVARLASDPSAEPWWGSSLYRNRVKALADLATRFRNRWPHIQLQTGGMRDDELVRALDREMSPIRQIMQAWKAQHSQQWRLTTAMVPGDTFSKIHDYLVQLEVSGYRESLRAVRAFIKDAFKDANPIIDSAGRTARQTLARQS